MLKIPYGFFRLSIASTVLLFLLTTLSSLASDVQVWIPEASIDYTVPETTELHHVAAQSVPVWVPESTTVEWVPGYWRSFFMESVDFDWGLFFSHLQSEPDWIYFDDWNLNEYPVVSVHIGSHWEIYSTPGFWSSETIPEHDEIRVVPAHTATLTSPGHYQDITFTPSGMTLSDGSMIPNTGWAYSYVNDADWSVDDREGTFQPAFDLLMNSYGAGAANVTLGASELLVMGESALPLLRNVLIRLGPGGAASGLILIGAQAALDEWVKANSLARAIAKAEEQRQLCVSYVTYEKLSTTTPRRVYSGRTSRRGYPAEVLARRDAEHKRTRPDFEDAVASTFVTTIGYSYWAWNGMRGREQQQIDFHNDNGHIVENIDNAVSPTNGSAMTYWLTATNTYGFIAPMRPYATFGLPTFQEPTTTVVIPPWNRQPLIP